MKYIHLEFGGPGGWAHCGVVDSLPEEVGENGELGVFTTEDNENMYVSIEPPPPPEPIIKKQVVVQRMQKSVKTTRQIITRRFDCLVRIRPQKQGGKDVEFCEM